MIIAQRAISLGYVFLNKNTKGQLLQSCPDLYIRRKLLVACLKSLIELVNTSACVNELLLSCKERMALRANFNSDLAALCGLGYNRLAACALDYALLIIRMNSLLHFNFSSFLLFRCSLTSSHERSYYTILILKLQYFFEIFFEFTILFF